MEPQLAHVEPSRRRSSSDQGHGSRDESDPPDNPFVQAACQLIRDTIAHVNGRLEKNEVPFQDRYELAAALDTFRKLGATPEQVSKQLGGKPSAYELTSRMEPKTIPGSRRHHEDRSFQLDIPRNKKKADDDMRLFQASLAVLERDGLLLAGKRYDPYTGQERGKVP